MPLRALPEGRATRTRTRPPAADEATDDAEAEDWAAARAVVDEWALGESGWKKARVPERVRVCRLERADTSPPEAEALAAPAPARSAAAGATVAPEAAAAPAWGRAIGAGAVNIAEAARTDSGDATAAAEAAVAAAAAAAEAAAAVTAAEVVESGGARGEPVGGRARRDKGVDAKPVVREP
jgi:hypothetical protein